jgi:Mrp family chromosome partitioning ATPase
MHTETSWRSGDLEDDLQPVVKSNRPSVASGPAGEDDVRLRPGEMNQGASGLGSSDAVQSRRYPTMRTGTSEYDALLGRVLKQIEDPGSAGFVGFTGCRRRAGVSTIAANVAIRAADQHNGSVLLVEANLTYPRQRQHFGVVEMPGLFEVLGSAMPIDKAIAPTRVANLSLLGAGMGRMHIPPVIMQDALEGFVQELRERFSLVVFDLPSDESLSHWAPLVGYLDSLLLVIASEETTQGDLVRVQNRCAVDGVKITGSILNRYRSYIPRFLRRV